MNGFSPFSFLNLTMWGLDLKSCSYLAITGPHMEPVLEAATSYLGQGIGSYPIPGAKLRPCFEVYREEDCFCVLNPPLSTSHPHSTTLRTSTYPQKYHLHLPPKPHPQAFGSSFCQGTTRWHWMPAHQLPKFLSGSEELGCWGWTKKGFLPCLLQPASLTFRARTPESSG